MDHFDNTEMLPKNINIFTEARKFISNGSSYFMGSSRQWKHIRNVNEDFHYWHQLKDNTFVGTVKFSLNRKQSVVKQENSQNKENKYLQGLQKKH